jgi:hypothetical protein
MCVPDTLIYFHFLTIKAQSFHLYLSGDCLPYLSAFVSPTTDEWKVLAKAEPI